METVIDAMKRGEHIELRGFGSFKVVRRAQRVARNPKTNEEVIVPEQYAPILKISKDFKQSVNKPSPRSFELILIQIVFARLNLYISNLKF